ncbi:4347_t:CDS:2 [Gigaspora margarita]|uniref:4347_t:CDS:1 n=1 Tax=Gigaspora margarita TaxID=4874 RepID=A0ABN7UL76_GIGMA|nr:4347_t:CDS:2 [Gigaspora margarita]
MKKFQDQLNNTAFSSCDDKILFNGINFSYFDENLFPDGLEFRIYTNNSISSLNDNISNQYPSIILVDPETYKQVVSDDSRILKSSNSEDKVLSIVLQNYYSLLLFQIHTVFLERIEFQDLDTSLEYGSAKDIYKKTSKDLVNYFGYSSKMSFTGQLNNSTFLNGSSSSKPYAALQVRSMSSILTTYKQVNSTTVLAFLSGLGGSTAFLLVIYKFCYGGHKPPGLLKPLLPC